MNREEVIRIFSVKIRKILRKQEEHLEEWEEIRLRTGQPLEVIAKHFIETKFIRPTVRPYKTDNYYAALMRQRQAGMEVNRIVQTKAAKTHKPHPEARGSASARSHKAAEKRGARRSGARQTR